MSMRDLFPGYYQRSEEELSRLWRDGIFVVDTNMLLNVYRYSPETRERYLETLSRLKPRLWIPYQVAYEYQDKRTTVIREQAKAYENVIQLLDTTLQKLKSSLDPYKRRHVSIDPVQLTEEITKAVIESRTNVQRAKNLHPDLKESDPLREKIEELFKEKDKIGVPYSKEKLADLYRQAELRFERHIPPGWEDEGKKDYIKRYGDVILWFQLIDHARIQKRPIIFITDDVKQDWWLSGEEAQGPIRPRPELVQEMYLEANVLFHMYQGYEFMAQAQHFLQLEAKPEIIEEIKEVGQQESSEILGTRLTISDLRGEAFQAEQATFRWLRETFPPQIEILGNRMKSPDFVIRWLDGTRIGVEVKLFRNFLFQNAMRSILEGFGLLNMKRVREEIDKLVIVFIYKTKMDTEKVVKIIQERIELPIDIIIVVAYLEADDRLNVVSTFQQFDQETEWNAALSQFYRHDEEFS